MNSLVSMVGVEWILLYLVLGSIVGFLAGLLGLSGSGLLVPLLSSIFCYQGINSDIAVHFALGTSLACMITLSIASFQAHASRGTVDWKIVRGMAPGIILGSFLVAKFAAKLDGVYIALFFSLVMALLAAQMFSDWQLRTSSKPICVHGLIFAGFGIGSLSALAAVGGGFLTITYLSYKNIDIKNAIGSSSAIGAPVAITGTVSYIISGWSDTISSPHTLGFIDVPAFLAISISSFMTASYGAVCSHRLPTVYLKKIFAMIALALSIKMLIVFI